MSPNAHRSAPTVAHFRHIRPNLKEWLRYADVCLEQARGKFGVARCSDPARWLRETVRLHQESSSLPLASGEDWDRMQSRLWNLSTCEYAILERVRREEGIYLPPDPWGCVCGCAGALYFYRIHRESDSTSIKNDAYNWMLCELSRASRSAWTSNACSDECLRTLWWALNGLKRAS